MYCSGYLESGAKKGDREGFFKLINYDNFKLNNFLHTAGFTTKADKHVCFSKESENTSARILTD